MSRLVTCGFEVQHLQLAYQVGEGEGAHAPLANIPAVETTTVRSGAASVKVSTASSAVSWLRDGTAAPALSLDRWYWLRTYVRAAATPASIGLLRFTDGALARLGEVRWLNTGFFRLFNKDVTNLGSFAVSANTWYCLELGIYVPTSGSGQLQMWVDGTLRASSASTNVGNSVPVTLTVGNYLTANPATNVFFDDVALNDDQGTEQNTRPGKGSITLMTPTSDNAVGGSWQAGAGATTNLWDAVNNLPPAGLSVASATDTSQIEDAANEAASYEAAFPTYTAAGVSATDRIAVVQAIAAGADNSASARNIFVSGVSGPALAEGTVATGDAAGVAGTYPNYWPVVRSAVGYSVATSASPVVAVRRETAADTISYCLVGVYVESRSVQTATLGLPSESDETQAQGRTKVAAVSQQTETDLALTAVARKALALGLGLESDETQALASRKEQALAQASETDAAQALTASRALELGQASETDSVSSSSAQKQAELGLVSEQDEALFITRQGIMAVPIGLATETDEALALTPSAPVQPFSPAFDWTPRRRIRRVTVVPLGIAKETDSALAFTAETKQSDLQREEEELLALV